MKGFLGIDAGTQGLSVVFTDENLNVLGTGDGSYEMVPDLSEGCYEQNPADWIDALRDAMNDLRKNLQKEFEVLSIGISGQMHGEVLASENGESIGNVRLWCDARNEAEGNELTKRFGVKMPKRITSARWLWTIRNQTAKAKQAKHLTTPAGWISYCLTGSWNLGIGDAAGMFPIDQATLDYNQSLLESFDELVGDNSITPIKDILPKVLKAGEEAGKLNERGAEILGITEGVPVAPAEGDQPAALAGSLIGAAGMVSVSFGTSVCANSVGDRPFEGVSDCVDHFCAPDGKPINMVWLRNGTTYMNCVVEMFGEVLNENRGKAFEVVMPKVLEADADCGGLLALPFMDDEPGLGVSKGGTATLIGLNPSNASPGNAVKAALLSTMFNLKLGSEVLDRQGYPRTELVLTGGLTKTQETGQILADVFNTPVTLLESAEEGTAWGAALMAKFLYEKTSNNTSDWATFLSHQNSGNRRKFTPDAANNSSYEKSYDRYKNLVESEKILNASISRS